jgi:Right handed beta helix region
VRLLACGLAILAAAGAAALGCNRGENVAGVARAPGQRGPAVTYSGPRKLAGQVVLRARAQPRAARVVAVSFSLDGRPLGSDTTPPYALDVDAARLPRERHRLRADAVDALGGRSASRPVTVRTARGRPDHTLELRAGRPAGHALAALRRGHVTVRLGPGRFRLHDVSLGDGARLTGDGPRTLIASPAGAYSAILVARGRTVRISDLALDGGGAGPDDGRAVAVFDGSGDVRLQRLRIRRVRRQGVTAWGAHSNVSVQDSAIDGGGRADTGVLSLGSDRSSDVSVIRTRIRGFRHYGIDFAQVRFHRPRAALRNVALDNRIAAIYDPATANGTHEGAIWSGGGKAALIGNAIEGTGWDGIETVGSSERVSIVDNRIARTRTGIYLEHSTNRSLVSGNAIGRVRTGINVEWRYGGVGSSRNVFTFNRIDGASETGIFLDVGSDGNRVFANVFHDGVLPAIRLQGSSRNRVRGNRACGHAGGEVVHEQSGRHDYGPLAVSRENSISDNSAARACTGE